MSDIPSTRDCLTLWRDVTLSALRGLSIDLSARQTGVLLTVYLSPEAQTVRSLAGALAVSKPAICRALDALAMAGLVKRKRDSADRRNVFIQRTLKGTVILAEMAEIVRSAADSFARRQELAEAAP